MTADVLVMKLGWQVKIVQKDSEGLEDYGSGITSRDIELSDRAIARLNGEYATALEVYQNALAAWKHGEGGPPHRLQGEAQFLLADIGREVQQEIKRSK